MKAWQNLVAEIEQQKETTRISQEELKTKESYLTDKEGKMQEEQKRLAVWEKKNAESEKHLIKIANATDEKVHRITTWAKELAKKEEHLNNKSCIKPVTKEEEKRVESSDAVVQTCQALETEIESNSTAIHSSRLASPNCKASLIEPNSNNAAVQTITNDPSSNSQASQTEIKSHHTAAQTITGRSFNQQ